MNGIVLNERKLSLTDNGSHGCDIDNIRWFQYIFPNADAVVLLGDILQFRQQVPLLPWFPAIHGG